jgi:uncharacterized protein (DUF433 family)
MASVQQSEPISMDDDQWFAERARQAMLVLGQCVEINPQKLGGAPLLRGTRFSIPQLLSEIAGGDAVGDISDNFELDKQQVQQLFHALAVFLDRPTF